MELVGEGVILASEDLTIGPNGKLLNPNAKPNAASTAFTESFTANYAKIATASPVFAQLRNVIDMLLAAALIEREDFYGKAKWPAETFASEQKLATERLNAPEKVPASSNALWKGARLFAPAGGVSIQPHMSFDDKHVLPDSDGLLTKSYKSVSDEKKPADRWWWD